MRKGIPPLFWKLSVCLRSSVSDRSGNVAIIFALCLIPMVGMIGIGVDYSRALAAKSVLDAAADAAALAAATEAESVLRSSLGVGAGGAAIAQSAGTLAGQQIFAANALRVGGWIGGVPTPTITVSAPANQTITAQASYTANIPTSFGGMFQVRQISISGLAASTLKLPSYVNISVAVDISQSMGLAATQAGMTQLQGLTPDQCAFGCHVVAAAQTGSGTPWSTTPYETIAHNASPPIQLRIDIIRQATQNMIGTAQSLQGSSGLISFALYTLQGGPGSTLSTLSSSSTNYSALTIAANGIDLGPNTSAGIGDSDLTTSMTALAAQIPVSGNGSTQNTAQQFVFLMTDGVQDVAGGCTDGHCTQAFNPTLCTALKNSGVTVGVIYTTYLQMPGDPRYLALVAPFDNQLPINLKACASAGWYYEASDATDIQNAINALFAKATGQGVLTQ